jgi:hypothetical protein
MIPAALSRFLTGFWLSFWRARVILVAWPVRPAIRGAPVVFADVQLEERHAAEAESAQRARAGESGGHSVPFLIGR